jgi:signal transduction histidine kinase
MSNAIALVDDPEIVFIDEDGAGPARERESQAWTIAIIDDDSAVHDGTRFALYDYTLNGRGLRILSAYSAAEGRALLAAEPEVAVVFLDVVMETDTAGLDLVDYIRNELGNRTVRIVLRTGQPGRAPERQVVVDYDINDYKAKTELTADKLFTTLTAALRSYEQLKQLTETRHGLGVIVEAAAAFFDVSSVERLAASVFPRLDLLLQARCSGLLALREARDGQGSAVLAGAGEYERLAGAGAEALPPEIAERIAAAFKAGRTDLDSDRPVLHLASGSGPEVVALVEPDRRLTEIDRELLELFAHQLCLAFDNVTLYAHLQDANARLEERVIQRTADLQKANQRLAAQRTSLRRANTFKNEMLGTVAHDLKNPLGVILGRTEILGDLLAIDPIPFDPIRTQLAHIRDSAKRLTGMVDELMAQAINATLDISIRRDPVDFAALVSEVVSANRPLADRKQQMLSFSGPTSLRVSGDQERLREAIDNLVGNAIKYTPMGGVIEVAVSADRSSVVCAVTDDGPGLSPEDLARVFGRFQRLSAKPTGGEGSTGLGLSIVKRIAELHGGRASAQSLGPGLGATFSLSLPAEAAQGSGRLEAAPAGERPRP